MKWLEKCKIQFLDSLVCDEATKILEEAAWVARKLWELNSFPQRIQDALAFFVAICHLMGPTFFEMDLPDICEELQVSADFLLLAGDHWAGIHNFPPRDNFQTRVSEMTRFFYGERVNAEEPNA